MSGQELASVADGSRIVVVDVETTGLGKQARIVEIGCVTIDDSGKIVDEWDTLVNPGGTVGATWIHGITEQMVQEAPTFLDIVPEITERLHGAFLAAHNLPFDAGMLRAEFERCEIGHDFGVGIDTLKLTRAKLQVACAQFGIELELAHSALCDARAAAELLLRVCQVRSIDLMSEHLRPVVLTRQEALPFGSTRPLSCVLRRIVYSDS